MYYVLSLMPVSRCRSGTNKVPKLPECNQVELITLECSHGLPGTLHRVKNSSSGQTPQEVPPHLPAEVISTLLGSNFGVAFWKMPGKDEQDKRKIPALKKY